MASITLGGGALAASIGRADPVVIGFAIVISAATAGYAFWRAWRNLRLARIIEDTPTSRARSVQQGYTELEGTGRLMDGPPIVAPLSGNACVWYRYKVEEQQAVPSRSGSRRQWVTVDKGVSNEVFWLEDGTGRIAIDPEGAEVQTEYHEVWYQGESRRRRSGAFSLLLSGVVLSAVATERRRYTEERIHPGEPLYVLGLLKSIGSFADTPNVDEEVRALLAEWKKDQPALIKRFDLDHDGKIDQQEWMLARAQARREVLKSRREQELQTADPVNLMSDPKDPGRPYLLASYRQRQLVRRYRVHAGWLGTMFFAAGSIALWLYNHRFL